MIVFDKAQRPEQAMGRLLHQYKFKYDMLIGGLFAGVLLAIAVWLLWAPIRLEIDTRAGFYRTQWSGIASVDWLPEQGLNLIEIRVFFWKRKIALFQTGVQKEKTDASKPLKKRNAKPAKKTRRPGLRSVKKILQTFEVRRCHIALDTGDYLWNAWLFPVFWLLKSREISVWINFQGQNEVSLLVQNRLGRVLWALVSS